jgi:hypothetical protein
MHPHHVRKAVLVPGKGRDKLHAPYAPESCGELRAEGTRCARGRFAPGGAAARRCVALTGSLFCREAFGGSVAALPRSNLWALFKWLRHRFPRQVRDAVAALPCFAPNFSPPPPSGLHRTRR